ncbi:transmembrane anterior posterior transformation protein 1-like isoform X2 [Hylaeus volcanicus]|nr:transmembrane anterior posterior transformation protein 1-like isoform X2 [Hylaeus volcanicus]XP_053990828.1 transmembrane anterior posterior transformation protein 1-like isoform X2 [Hylaeus volcanicus]
MPLQALVALFKLSVLFCSWSLSPFQIKFFQQTKQKKCLGKYVKTSSFFFKYLVQPYSIFNPSKFFCTWNVQTTLSLPQACDLTRTLILIMGIFLFNKFFDVSDIYHCIRAQSFMKLYVIFNMLELFERLWRSLGRDAIDSLMRQIVSLSFVDYTSSSKPNKLFHTSSSTFNDSNKNFRNSCSPATAPSSLLPENFKTTFKSLTQQKSSLNLLFNQNPVTAPFPCRNVVTFFVKMSFNMKQHCSKNILSGVSPFFSIVANYQKFITMVLRLVFSICLVLVYVVVHSLMHLLRALLLNISINSSDSVMFLIVTSNNFAELKSTVFKKYSRTSLFSIVASDAVERFYLFADGINVFFRLAASIRTPLSSCWSVLACIVGMILLECFVDWAKHFFLLKLNFLPTNTLNYYREALWADILVSRDPDTFLHDSTHLQQWKVPCRSVYSFPHICSRRLGFVALPLTSQLLCLLPQFPWKENFCTAAFTIFFLWFCLLLLKLIVSMLLLSLATLQRSTLTVSTHPELQDLCPL